MQQQTSKYEQKYICMETKEKRNKLTRNGNVLIHYFFWIVAAAGADGLPKLKQKNKKNKEKTQKT